MTTSEVSFQNLLKLMEISSTMQNKHNHKRKENSKKKKCVSKWKNKKTHKKSHDKRTKDVIIKK
jgi:hypothetical protein